MHTPDWRRSLAELCRVARSRVVFDYPALTSGAALQAAVARALHDEADRVSEVVDAAQALADIAVEVPDVVVVRVSAPVSGNGEGSDGSGRSGEPDGVVLIRALAADERLAAIPVVVVTEPVGGEREAAWFGHAAVVLSAGDITPEALRVAVRDAAAAGQAS